MYWSCSCFSWHTFGHVPSAVGQMIDRAFWASAPVLDIPDKHIQATSPPHGGTTPAWVQSAANFPGPQSREKCQPCSSSSSSIDGTISGGSSGGSNSKSAWPGWYSPPRLVEFFRGWEDEAICLELRSTY